MHHITEILRLRFQNNLSVREIARSCRLPPSTVNDYLKRAQGAGLSWPLPEGLEQEALLKELMSRAQASETLVSRALPDWKFIHSERRRKNVTLRLLWQEYRQAHPEGYGYSRFCELYHRWAQSLDPVLRQVHIPGEKLFVDWAGQTMPIHNPTDGTVTEASVFVAVLGASNKLFARAFANQKLPSWIAAHVQAYSFYGGVARLTIPDNPKTAVSRPCRYEPLLHRTYQEMAEHYGTVIIPTRPRKPRDKSKVETGVQIAQRQILAALRDRKFFSVAELNEAIAPLLARLNQQPFQKLEGSRNGWFEALDKPALLALPATSFELATWSRAKVNIDYHVIVDYHYYSVPHQLIHQHLDVRITRSIVELFLQGKRVAAHRRSSTHGKFTTIQEHRPKSHRKHLQWTPGRMVHWAGSIGPHCARLVEHILQNRPHPEQGYRSCLGIIRLGRSAGPQRLEAACHRALHFGTCSYQSIQSILKNKLDAQPLETQMTFPSPRHTNVRGGPYYN